MLDALLEKLAAGGLVQAGGKQRTDSTHVIAAVAALNGWETITLRFSLPPLDHLLAAGDGPGVVGDRLVPATWATPTILVPGWPVLWST